MKNKNMAHSVGVAHLMRYFAEKLDLPSEEQDRLFLIGLLHDVGYAFDPEDHATAGGAVLKAQGFAGAEIIAQHGKLEHCGSSFDLDLLNLCDMMVARDGTRLTLEERMAEIAYYHGKHSTCTGEARLVVDYCAQFYREHLSDRLDATAPSKEKK